MKIDEINNYIEDGLANNVFPGCALGISHKNDIFSNTYGYTSYKKTNSITQNTLFDLASLTKPLATVLSCLVLIQRGLIHYDMTLDKLLGCVVPEDKKNINLEQLLSHSSGFDAHKDYYKKLEKFPLEKRKKILINDILKEPLVYKPGSKTIYSDIGFIVLFFIIEFQIKSSLENFVYEYIFEPLHIVDICYNPKEKGHKKFAFTENCPWRKKEMQGEVHDQNTWVLGGVSGQAGLFGSIDAVLSLVIYIKDLVQGKRKHPYIGKELLQEAIIKRLTPESNCWGLGFDTPSQPSSSAGQFISDNSCGHLGFTGTSFWIDFEKDISVVLLTNRINPTIDNIQIRDFRPGFHDLIFG